MKTTLIRLRLHYGVFSTTMPPLPVSARPRSPPWVGGPWVVLLLWFAAFASVSTAAADSARRRFDIPAGTAVTTIKRAAQQAGLEVVYSATLVEGVRTQAVIGEFRPREGIERLLAGTGLRLVEDKQTGALSISREPAKQPKARPPDSTPPRNGNPATTQQEPAPMKSRTLLTILAGWLANGTMVDAQNAANPQRDEAVVLSPFTVNAEKDTSWTATTTLVGSRTNQELARLPATVDVITSEFMKDVGLFSMEDAAQFVAGVQVPPRLESRNDDGRITFRGLSGVANTSRNFFVWYVPSDSYNVDRYDFSKGSNSLMFGDSSPGGQATIYTKRAVPRNFEEVLASYGSYGTYRAQLDVNRKLSRNLFARFNAVDRSNRTYIRGSREDLRAVDLAVTWQPFKNTSIRTELERGRQHRERADSALVIFDGAATGRGFSTNNVWYVTSDKEILNRTSTFPAAIDRSGPTGSQVSLLAGQERAVRLPDGTSKTFKGFDKYTNVLGPNDYSDHGFNVVTATIDQRIGDLVIEAAYNQQFRHMDRNDVSFGTTTSPPSIRVDSTGRPYVDNAVGGATYKIFGNIIKTGRLSAAYPFNFGRWGKQFAVVTAMRQRDFGSNRRYGYGNALGTGAIGNNTLVYRAYLDDPGITGRAFWDQFLLPNLPRTPTFKPVQYENYTITGPFYDLRYLNTYTASLSGEYFGGRLNTLIGASWNGLTRKMPASTWYTTDASGNVKYPGTPWDNPGAYVYDPTFNINTRSSMFGLSGALLRREQATVNLYGVVSESFNFQSRQMFFGPDMGPVNGKTKEVGLKGDLFNRKLSYTVAFYDIRRSNVIFTWSPDVLSLTQLEDLINPNDVLPTDPRYVPVVNGLNNERRTVRASEQSRGFDLTLQGQRWHGLQTRLTLSATRVRAQPDFSQFKAYLDAAIARTTAANAPGGNVAMAEDPILIASAQTIIGANTLTDAVSGRRSAPYGASFVLDYETPFVRRLRVGFNGWLTPNYNIAISNGVVYKGAAMFPTGFYTTYDRRILNRQFTFRFNVQNLYDLINGNSPYRKTGSNGLNALTGRLNYIYRYAEPLSWNLSASVRF